MIDLSIITNCHNEGRLMHATTQSVSACIAKAKQMGISIEWLVVRDKPDQLTVDYTDKHCSTNARMLNVNVGDIGLARNEGIKAASGKYIALIDADDLWYQGWLVDAYRFAESLKHQKAILHPEKIIFFEAVRSIVQLYENKNQELDYQMLPFYNLWSVSTFGLREIYLDYPYQASDLENGFGYEDWHWNCETFAGGVKHLLVPRSFYCVRAKSWQKSLFTSSNKQRCIISPTKIARLAYQEL